MTWDIMSNGLCLTANISECRSQESGCSLSDMLVLVGSIKMSDRIIRELMGLG